MQGQRHLLGSRLTGLVARRAVAVRETARGFSIESTLDTAPCAARHRTYLRDAAIALAAVAGIAGLWALPIGANLTLPMELKVLGGTMSAGTGILGWSLFRRPERYVVHVDQIAERIRVGFRGAGETVDWCDEIAFDEARDLVVKRPRFGRGHRMTLCLRIRARKRPLEIASGDDTVIGAIFDRVKTTLLPAETGVVSRRLQGQPATGRQHVFPALGPDEIAA